MGIFPILKTTERSKNILTKHGEDAFYNYCNEVNMPLDDRQGVLGKWRYNYNVDDLVKTTFTEKHQEG